MPNTTGSKRDNDYYHVLVRGNNDHKIFVCDQDKEKFLFIIKRYEEWISLLAYCILDTHAHLLIKLNNSDLPTIMKRINISYASYFNNKYNKRGHVFYDRYNSAGVENLGQLLALLRYIQNNPLAKNMQYPWSSYTEYLYYFEKQRAKYLTDPQYVLKMFGNTYSNAVENFISYCNKQNNDIFLDINESIDYRIQQMIENYLIENNIKQEELGYKQNREHKIKLIILLKSKGNYSIRKIADTLNLNRGIVYNIIKKYF